ncbi:hypothetical protein [Raoultella planticola]|uniref:hypothetical protein n=1 Tax=Raoultella planticola TaxID=575 RepID=UPI0011E87737|nr:hypothetical protein [Raoultella planticola]
MSFEKESSQQRDEQEAGQHQGDNRNIAEMKDGRRVSAAGFPGATGARHLRMNSGAVQMRSRRTRKKGLPANR